MNRIGERIKKRREMQNLHLNELAEKVGISSSALSQIENSKSFPSLITLKNIAESLYTTVGELIGENEKLVNNPVVYRNAMKFIDQNNSGSMIYLLSQHDLNKNMDTYLVRFNRNSSIDGFFPNTHGQVFCYVSEGEVKFRIEDKEYYLKQGDSLYFKAKVSKEAVNSFDGISEMLWIQSPPNY